MWLLLLLLQLLPALFSRLLVARGTPRLLVARGTPSSVGVVVTTCFHSSLPCGSLDA